MLVCPGTRCLLPAACGTELLAQTEPLILARRGPSDLPGLRIWITKTPKQKSQSCQIAVLRTNKVGKEDKRKGIN